MHAFDLRRVTVRTQLLLALTLIILLFVAHIATSLIVSNREEQAVNQLLETVAEIELAQQLQIEVQLSRYHESNAALQVIVGGTNTIDADYGAAIEHVRNAILIVEEFEAEEAEESDHDEFESGLMSEVHSLLSDHQTSLIAYQQELFPERGDITSGKVGAMMIPLQELDELIDASRAVDLGSDYGENLSPSASRQLPAELQLLEEQLQAQDPLPTDQLELLDEAQAAFFDLILFDLAMYGRLNDMYAQAETVNDMLDEFIEEELGEQAEAQERFESASDLRRTAQASTALAAILVGSILAFGTARLITSPIESLQQATTQLAQGEYGSRVSFARTNEFGELAKSFNHMADAIEGRDQKIRQQATALEAALKEAQEASRLKGEFLSTMSHELRTPLNSILGYAGLLKMGLRGDLPDRAEEAVADIQVSGEHLLALINDVLDLSKIEAGRMEFMSDPIQLAPLVESWQTQTRVLAEQKNLAFKVQIDPAMPASITGDRERLTQIAINLLSNAVKFTDNGSVELRVAARSNNQWVIEVADTGTGIPPEAQQFIFDEFRQVDGTSTRRVGGTGLGLAITRRLAEGMKGTIQLRTELGVGSTFTVTLPLIPTIESVLEAGE